VDGEVVLTPEAKMQLVDRVQQNAEPFKAMPVRRVYIPKPGGKQRPLGIPVILDRVHQARVVNALEPEWEARFEPKSYGFRPGRGCQDAIQAVHETAKGKSAKRLWALDADLASAFDLIAHDHILNQIGSFPARGMIRAWLKAGVVEQGRVHRSEDGVPQGGVVSPLLLNVALHGMETAAGVRYYQTDNSAGKAVKGSPVLIRYADDCAPRTRKEELSRCRVRRTRCCARDEGAGPVGLVALRGRPAGGGRKPPRGAPVKSRGAELVETARHRVGQVWITKASGSEPLMRRRKRIGDIETGVELLPRDEPGGCLLIGQAVSGVKVARAWSGLSCGTREPVAPTGRLASGAVVACGRASKARTPSSGNCEGESSCAGHRGGPSRISDEGPVIGLERRGRVVLASLAINRGDVG
jgi:hypothetical protein